jgi:hypothetical protein
MVVPQADGDPGLGLRVGSTEDEVPDADAYAFEMTVATQDWLPTENRRLPGNA